VIAPVLLSLSLSLGLAAPSGDFAITNVKAMVGNGEVVEGATVVVKKGKIASVDRKPAPKGMTVVEGRGRIVTPGLIESITQLGLTEVSLEPATNDHGSGGNVTPAFRAADGFNPRSVRIPVEREQGVTSVLALPTGGLIAGQGAWVELTGDDDDTPSADKPTVMVGHAGTGGNKSRGQNWLRLREIVDDVRFYKKNKKAYDKAGARKLSMSRLHLEAMLPVVAGKLPLLLSADRASDLKTALRFAKDEKLKIVLAGAAEAWSVASELAKAKVPVILQPSQQKPSSFDSLFARDDATKLLDDAGVRYVISAGVDWDQNARRLRQEAGIAVAHGLDYQKALTAITKTPAEVFGKGKEVGTLEKGKRANLVLWSGDPFELSTMADAMWIGGEPIDLTTRQTELARRYLSK
jgi:imidazolonepropionase-like amidohydrolase